MHSTDNEKLVPCFDVMGHICEVIKQKETELANIDLLFYKPSTACISRTIFSGFSVICQIRNTWYNCVEN